MTAPLRVGLAGPATIRALLNYGIRCGIGESARWNGMVSAGRFRLTAADGSFALTGDTCASA